MLKTAFVAACVLAVSGSVVSAQSRLQGPNEAPYGANGPAERGGTPLKFTLRKTPLGREVALGGKSGCAACVEEFGAPCNGQE